MKQFQTVVDLFSNARREVKDKTFLSVKSDFWHREMQDEKFSSSPLGFRLANQLFDVSSDHEESPAGISLSSHRKTFLKLFMSDGIFNFNSLASQENIFFRFFMSQKLFRNSFTNLNVQPFFSPRLHDEIKIFRIPTFKFSPKFSQEFFLWRSVVKLKIPSPRWAMKGWRPIKTEELEMPIPKRR